MKVKFRTFNVWKATFQTAAAVVGWVYRWWPTKPALVMEAFIVRAARDVPVPDTGSLREDLRLVLGHLIYALTRLGSGRIMAGLVAAGQDDPQLAGAFRGRFLAERRQVLRTVLARAQARGELAGQDHEFLIDMMYGVVYYRLLLTQQPLDGPLATTIIDHVLALARS
ncbi:MAG TPA: TetR-like C-terminal domain-containing protein [Pseudonocardia sp.]